MIIKIIVKSIFEELVKERFDETKELTDEKNRKKRKEIFDQKNKKVH